eukprot:9485485-Pyramimonas_sp.AAC.1
MDASGSKPVIASLARLDRIYCSDPSSVLIDFKPNSLPLWATQGDWPMSDYAPIVLRLHVSQPGGFRIPSGVPRRP